MLLSHLQKNKFLLFFCILIFGISCQDLNSNTTDKTIYGTSGPCKYVTDLEQANCIMTQRCITCHTNYHNAWIGYTTNDAWINSGLVNRGDAANSLLIRRMINSGEGNMPQGGSAIPDSEYQQLLDWINNMP